MRRDCAPPNVHLGVNGLAACLTLIRAVCQVEKRTNAQIYIPMHRKYGLFWPPFCKLYIFEILASTGWKTFCITMNFSDEVCPIKIWIISHVENKDFQNFFVWFTATFQCKIGLALAPLLAPLSQKLSIWHLSFDWGKITIIAFSNQLLLRLECEGH